MSCTCLEPTTDPVNTEPDTLDRQLTREWLITNDRGGFASGTCLGIPTRRYHGLLVAPARPPLERWTLLSAVLERVGVGGRTWETPGFEFASNFHPRGFEQQTQFAVSNAAPLPWVRFAYSWGHLRLTKSIFLPHGSDEVAIAYRLEGPPQAPITLGVEPFTGMRDFHGLTRAFDPGYPIEAIENGAVVYFDGGPRLVLQAERGRGVWELRFEVEPHWWRQFHYREEAHRGQDCREDLFVPGWFQATGIGTIEIVVRARAEFPFAKPTPPPAPPSVPVSVDTAQPRTLSVEERLREAANAFVVKRRRVDGSFSTTILAGYHWFGDWGRDTFISLPGLLLETERFAEAREVFTTFASAQKDGLIPNKFSDYGDGCDYNSVDASLWYIHAADAYCRASGDKAFWKDLLGPVCERIVEAFIAGTEFNIHMDNDALLACGDPTTQITWMDAKYGDTVFTPRHGKPVEINALWYHALRVLAERSGDGARRRAEHFTEIAEHARNSFRQLFWNNTGKYLYDVIRDGYRDPAVRPNQIFAVSLPHSPLLIDQQRAVVERVDHELFTPYGLRSLSPEDPAYHGRCEGNPFERDSAYHQGTVWGWLIGPYVEAHLRVHGFSTAEQTKMRTALGGLIEHLDQAGLGQVSEIFDGDAPHEPRACIAQAWSVSELLRAWRLTEPG